MSMNTQFLAALLSVLAFPISALADRLVMKDGSTLEGTIVREDASSYVLEVQVTKSIKDERTIPKKDVDLIHRQRPDQIAFAIIAKLLPTPDLLSSANYAQRLRAVEDFLKKYPESLKITEAQRILTTLKTEANEILAGGIKFEGKIIPVAEYKANAYDIDAHIQEMKIRRLMSDSQTLLALRAFGEFERDFRNTTAYAALLPQIIQLVSSYLSDTRQSLETLESREKERMSGLQRMSITDRRISTTAIQEETAAFEALLKSEKDARINWVTPHPFYRASMEDTVTFANQELARLTVVKNEPRVDGGMAYRNALSLIQSKGDPTEVARAINAAKTAKIPVRYMTLLEAEASAATATP